MIILSCLQTPEEQKTSERFSDLYPSFNQTFYDYSTNTALKIRFPTSDFYIRMHKPSNLDYMITLWIAGEKSV